MKITPLLIAAGLAVAAAGCDQSTPSATEANQPAESPPGRAETRNVQAASLIGHDGKQIQQRLDRVLDQNAQRNERLQTELQKDDER